MWPTQNSEAVVWRGSAQPYAAQRDVKQVCPDPSPPQAVFMTQTIAQFRHACGVLRADA